MEPRNPLPGTEGLASQWDLPFSTDHSEEEDGHVHGDVQSDRWVLRIWFLGCITLWNLAIVSICRGCTCNYMSQLHVTELKGFGGWQCNANVLEAFSLMSPRRSELDVDFDFTLLRQIQELLEGASPLQRIPDLHSG